jgi:hypothetical protein
MKLTKINKAAIATHRVICITVTPDGAFKTGSTIGSKPGLGRGSG